MSLEKLNLEAKSLCENIRENIKNLGRKLRLRDAWKIVQTAVGQVVILIQSNVGDALSGPEKKAYAMRVIGAVVDIVCAVVVIPGIPLWVNGLLGKYIKQFLLEVADGSIDAIVSTFHATGVFEQKKEGN